MPPAWTTGEGATERTGPAQARPPREASRTAPPPRARLRRYKRQQALRRQVDAAFPDQRTDATPGASSVKQAPNNENLRDHLQFGLLPPVKLYQKSKFMKIATPQELSPIPSKKKFLECATRLVDLHNGLESQQV